MSNDKTTLADAQPGGRVRLGDALLPCPFCGAPAERIDFGIGSGENEGGSCIACTVCQHSGPIEFGYKENFVSNWNRRALSAQPSPGGQGDALKALDDLAAFCSDDTETVGRHVAVSHAALAARQPVGEFCSNCHEQSDRVMCHGCAGKIENDARWSEFLEVRELTVSLGEGSLDHLLPTEWHEKPLLRFRGAYDEGDDSVGISPRSANVLADDQTGTVLGDYLAARAAKDGGL